MKTVIRFLSSLALTTSISLAAFAQDNEGDGRLPVATGKYIAGGIVGSAEGQVN